MAEMRTLEDRGLHRAGALVPPLQPLQPTTSSFGLFGLTDSPFFMILPFLAEYKLFN